MAKKKFIIVSNRLPISVSKKDGKLVFTSSSGGLATALSRLYKGKTDSIWIGWPGICLDDITESEQTEITKKLGESGCHPVFLTRRQVEKYYDGYSNDTIWPLFHYFQTLTQHNDTYWRGYKRVNEIFAETVVRFAAKDSTIWVHDYHLMLLPKKLREDVPEAAIGFFLHIPFPSYEVFRLLPNRADILEGLLGADLVGFHVYDYARHFLSSVLRVIGLKSTYGTITAGTRSVKVDAFPIGIDYEKFARAAQDKETKKELKSISNHYKDMKLILSMDRLDYTKGILKRLIAFENFLKNNPKYLQKVVLVMVVVPSRIDVTTYKQLKREIEQTISRINGDYSTVNWTPISYQFKNLPFKRVAALLIQSDVALLTPLRDGMNLVAKEYVATKQNKSGALILSEMTGAIDELPEAITVNPNDINVVEDAIKTALEMPAELQRDKIESMQKRLSHYTVYRWARDFIEQLQQANSNQLAKSDKILDQAKKQKILRSFRKSKRKLILLDYDGTVTDLVSTHAPEKSRPAPKLLRLLSKLSDRDDTLLCVVSGRPKDVLEDWFDGTNVALSAEHGGWVKTGNEWSRHEVSLNKYRKKIMSLLKHYVDRTAGASIEEKDFSIVWHYRNVPSELAQARNSSIEYEITNLVSGSDLAVFKGSKVLEVKPRNINKGMVAEEFLAMSNPDFVLCIGDDTTDEDMFKVLPDRAFSIKVGLGETGARFQVLEPKNVVALLKEL